MGKHGGRRKKSGKKKSRRTKRRPKSYSYSYYSESRSRSRGGAGDTKKEIEKFIEFNALNPEVSERLRKANRQVQRGVLRDGENVKDNARNPNGVIIQRIRKHEVDLGLGHGGPPKRNQRQDDFGPP